MEVGVLRNVFWCLCLVISGGVVYVAFVVSTGVCVCNVFVIGAVLVYGILESPSFRFIVSGLSIVYCGFLYRSRNCRGFSGALFFSCKFDYAFVPFGVIPCNDYVGPFSPHALFPVFLLVFLIV